MLDIKRKLDEILTIYSLEEELLDIYVEGPTDKFIIENFLEYKKIDRSVLEIDDIDLRETQEKFPDLNLLSNKDKLIALSRLLSSNKVPAKVKCIVDRDFDGILDALQINNHLLYTDYSCIESYILNKKQLDKIVKFGIKNFPHNTDTIIIEISKVLSSLFILRMVNAKFKLNFPLPKIDTKLGINKVTGICQFNFENYIETYINVNKLREKKDEIRVFINEITEVLGDDIRYNMNGHDFIEILFNYINKIKNTPNFKIENFERAVYLSIQPDYLEDYELFKTLVK